MNTGISVGGILVIVGIVIAIFWSLILGIIVALIGLIAFWFLEVSSLIFIFMMLNYFLSGHMVPLDWLPGLFRGNPAAQEIVRKVMDFLPFGYLAYVPASIMLGKVQGAALATHLAAGTGWVVLLLASNRIVFARGLRRYSAFGG